MIFRFYRHFVIVDLHISRHFVIVRTSHQKRQDAQLNHVPPFKQISTFTLRLDYMTFTLRLGYMTFHLWISCVGYITFNIWLGYISSESWELIICTSWSLPGFWTNCIFQPVVGHFLLPWLQMLSTIGSHSLKMKSFI